jgi:hypothetical protein
MTHQIESVELIKPDFAYVYAKVARHVAAAYAVCGYDKDVVAKELKAAMEAIEIFEATSLMIHSFVPNSEAQ